MKKIVSGLVGLLLVVLGMWVGGGAANASETKKEAICHATASDVKGFVPELVARDSIINGGHGANGVNAGDIIAPFDYNFDGGAVEHYPGQNWSGANVTLWQNGCKAAVVVLTPVLPKAPVQTCVSPGTLVVPAQPAGINVSSTADDKGNYTVSYQLPASDAYTTYVLPQGFVNPVTVGTVDARSSDQYWDAAKGACVLPDTGAGQNVQWWMIPAAGGMILLAALLFTLNGVLGRRNKA